jgi:hypothetical protein
MKKKVKCIVCKGTGKLPPPKNDPRSMKSRAGMVKLRRQATIILRENNYSFRQIMDLLRYKSPNSVTVNLAKGKKGA